MKGKTYLKVTGILMLIGGILGLVSYGLLSLLMGYAVIDQGAGGGGISVTMIAVIYMIASIIQLIAGVMGIRGCNKADKADGCFKIGIVVLIISILAAIVNMAGAGFAASSVIYALLGLVVPGLYIYGAKLNRDSLPIA
ncbi:hypothetical protein DW091_14280 [Eubacterium sp. AM05-23]|uniref:hypothetical protein n=1 Tax=Eubacterium TaxID=1730 RepID=UPI00073567FC|nr:MULTISPECIES: hypothetical protein [Eubacterium]ALU16178.1 hypothetical protein ACH52_3442 [Eubacterium limosum]MBS6340553.1 hypothetical protein [Eubacterium limosum]MDO5432252.1 hypothetical protein [Eubacterium sp.]RHO56294.1 hypothetical protein DW091_14280 [Eubacterium sp. AM05-23]WPK81741.1 hypothetical protein EUMA32_31980 [Eubacterium maltosivorans]